MKETNEQTTRFGQSSYLQLVLSHWEMGEEASSLTRSMARDSRAAWEASLLRMNSCLLMAVRVLVVFMKALS